MLSLGKLALGQQRYYERQVAQGEDDYYAGRGEAPGQWIGSGAVGLGLSGPVSAGQFGGLLSGSDPRDPDVRLRRSAKEPTVAALDLTFSAPKSVSVLVAIAPDEFARELVAAHELALRGALEYLEQRALFVRRGHDGVRVETAQGFIAAAYRHRMSRALDPQLHTHVVAANMTQGPDGRYSAIHAAPLYRAAKTAGYLYQAHLRALLTERLGLRFGEVNKGAAELRDIPEEVLREFSKRRQQMRELALAGGIGLDTKASAQSAALATRERKSYGLDTHTWREEVRARASELGLGAREVNELIAHGRRRSPDPREAVEERVLGDHLASAEGLTARSNTFDERALLQEFAAAASDGATVSEVRGQAKRFTERADVLPVRSGEMTTAELVSCERQLIAAVLGRAREGTAALDGRTVEQSIAAADRPLTAEQAQAVRSVLSSADGVSVIEALAGTGKTYTASVLRAGYERAGYEVIGVAPTGRAARELSEEAGIPGRTLDRLLLDLERGEPFSEKSVLILDEAGMAPTRLSARMLRAAERAGAKVVAIGDPGQLSSVQAGGWLSAVAERLGSVSLREVIRQRDPEERAALAALHDRQPQRYLEWAQSKERIETFNDPADARRQALTEWQRASDELGPDQAVLITRNNDLREVLNDAAREIQRARGALGEEMNYGAIELAQGDRVICRQNDRRLDVDNGTRGTVVRVDGEGITLRTDAGALRELPTSYIQEHVEHAYALTGHGMQGGTVERATVIATPHELSAGWSYTALSRARGETRLFVYEENLERERREFAPSRHELATERGDPIHRVARRMRERDDEDLAVEQLESAHADELASELPEADGEKLSREQTADHALSLPTDGDRLAQLRDVIHQLEGQLAQLPTRELRRLDDLKRRFDTLEDQRFELAAELARLPEPRRRLGREHDGHSLERARLAAALDATEEELALTRGQGKQLTRGLGEPRAIFAERDRLIDAISEHSRELIELRDTNAEREVEEPAPWATRMFGERPDETGTGRDRWDASVRQAARYRLQYGITSEVDPLGPEPSPKGQQRDWQRAHDGLERVARQTERGLDSHEIDMGL